MTVDASWEEGGDNWAVTVEGWDSEGYRFQLETRSNSDGQEGWLDAASEMDAFWRPRAIGFDGAAYQNRAIQNLMRYDPRLRRLRPRMTKVPTPQTSKPYRIKQFVAEPLKMFKILLDPRPSGIATRDEMRLYKGNGSQDGIVDSMSMAPAVARRKRSDEETSKYSHVFARQIDPVTGCPWAA